MDLPPDILPQLSGGAALVLLAKELGATWWKSRQKQDGDTADALRRAEVAAARLDERVEALEADAKDRRRVERELLNHTTEVRGHLEHLREHMLHAEKRSDDQVSRLFELVRELRGDTNPKGRPPA